MIDFCTSPPIHLAGSHYTKVITETTAEIIEALHNTMQKSKPVILGVGEKHDNPNHVILPSNIMSELDKQNIPFLYATEAPKNIIQFELRCHPEIEDPERAIQELRDNNLYNEFNRSAEIFHAKREYAPLSRFIVSKYIEKHRIQKYNVDMARTRINEITHVDLSSDTNKKYWETAGTIMLQDSNQYQPLYQRKNTDVTGIRSNLARNLHMIDGCKSLITQHPEIDVILLNTGDAHIDGISSKDAENTITKTEYPKNHSLHALALQEGISFLGVTLSKLSESNQENILNITRLVADFIPKKLLHSGDVAEIQRYENQYLSDLRLDWVGALFENIVTEYEKEFSKHQNIIQSLCP